MSNSSVNRPTNCLSVCPTVCLSACLTTYLPNQLLPAPGVIDEEAWKHATHWLLENLPPLPLHAAGGQGLASEPSPLPESSFVDTTFDTTLWGSDPKLMSGHALCHTIRRHTKSVAADVLALRGRPPSLTVITVGHQAVGTTHPTADRRLELYGSSHASWFSKNSSGTALGVDVNEINLPATATTDEVLGLIRSLQQPRSSAVDGIQLMWPLPDHLDSLKLYQSIPVHQDVDGAHYIAQVDTSSETPFDIPSNTSSNTSSNIPSDTPCSHNPSYHTITHLLTHHHNTSSNTSPNTSSNTS